MRPRLRLGAALRAFESESDLVQSVCADLLTDLAQIEYRGEAPFRQWLYTAVLNKIRNKQRHYRAQKRRPHGAAFDELDEALLVDSYAALCSPSHEAIAREEVELLERAFDQHYREVLTLSRIVGLSQERIAEQMGRSVPSVRNLLSRALVKLAGEMAVVHRTADGTGTAG